MRNRDTKKGFEGKEKLQKEEGINES